jgi:chromosome segregation ATPase
VTLRAEIQKLDGLVPTIRKLRGDEIQLKTTVQSLRNDVTALQNQKNSLHTELEATRKEFTTHLKHLLEETNDIINTIDQQVFDQKRGFHPRATAIVTNTMETLQKEIDKQMKNWQKAFDKMNQNITDAATAVNQFEQRSHEAGKFLGQLVNLRARAIPGDLSRID